MVRTSPIAAEQRPDETNKSAAVFEVTAAMGGHLAWPEPADAIGWLSAHRWWPAAGVRSLRHQLIRLLFARNLPLPAMPHSAHKPDRAIRRHPPASESNRRRRCSRRWMFR